MNAADDLQDRLIQHQVWLLRYGGGLRNRLIKVLNQGDTALTTKTREELEKIGTLTPLEVQHQTSSIDRAIGVITNERVARWREFQKTLIDEVTDLGVQEVDFTVEAMELSLPFWFESPDPAIRIRHVAAEQISAAVRSRPFQGRHLRDWAKGIESKDLDRLKAAIRQGVIEQQPIEDIVRTIRGTRANKYADGILQISRRDAEAITRTAVNHISNVARNDVFEANADIIQGIKWVATLDGRSSAVCRGRDGRIAAVSDHGKHLPKNFPRLVPKNARPPAHINCRSTTVAIFDINGIADSIGERTFVRDTRTGRQREKDFREEARTDVGPEQWDRLSPKKQTALISQRRRDWTAENVGRVPAETTYDEWLRRQPKDFQDEVLGKEKAALFREGRKLDRFVDRRGRELTLRELKGITGAETIQPAIRLKQRKSSSVSFRKEIAAANSTIPKKVADRLGRQGVEIKTARRFVDIRPELAEAKPRGWRDGETWKNSNGGYDPNTKQIVLGEFLEEYLTGKVVSGPVPGGTLRHEVGHAWDELGFDSGAVRDRLDFRNAHAADIIKTGATFNDDDLKSIAYFLESTDDVNRQETVAELFGVLTGGGSEPDVEPLIRRAFPKSLKVLERAIKETK